MKTFNIVVKSFYEKKGLIQNKLKHGQFIFIMIAKSALTP